MKSKIAIYLAGSIQKGHENVNESYWSSSEMSLLKDKLNTYEIIFLNPGFRTDDLSDQFSVFGRDMLQVFSSDIVFVDARNRRGLGVGAEMMWAKINNIPVVTWTPKNSHYHKEQTTVLGREVSNFIHPFVESLSDKIVENLTEGALWIAQVMSNPNIEIKGISHIGAAMQHYRDRQLHLDQPMKDLIATSHELGNRMQRPHPQFVKI